MEKWINIKNKMPEPTEWCWIWFEYDNGDGHCEKMYLTSSGKWMRNYHQ